MIYKIFITNLNFSNIILKITPKNCNLLFAIYHVYEIKMQHKRAIVGCYAPPCDSIVQRNKCLLHFIHEGSILHSVVLIKWYFWYLFIKYRLISVLIKSWRLIKRSCLISHSNWSFFSISTYPGLIEGTLFVDTLIYETGNPKPR